MLNKGVLDEAGNPVPTPHNMYVNDNLIADVKSKIIQAMSASIGALFILMGYSVPERRKSAPGIRINTRVMVVGMPDHKLDAMDINFGGSLDFDVAVFRKKYN
eukprot:15360977-Ditylum_brightwellii.AAC.1